jgi:hypothetical protein
MMTDRLSAANETQKAQEYNLLLRKGQWPQTVFFFSLLLCICLLAACSSGPQKAEVVNELPAIYPDYVEVTIPVGIAPLNFAMADDSVTAIDVEVNGAWGGTLHSKGACTDFDTEIWHAMVKQNRGGQLNVTVCAKRDGKWKRYRDFCIHVSKTALSDWGITYRHITSGQDKDSPMGLYERELSTFEEKSLLDQDTDEDTMVYHYWHPGGRYCAFSTNKTSQMFHIKKENNVEVYDSSSDVFVYDTETHQIVNDTLIMKKYWAENCPAFSPDGKWLYFTTARRQVYPNDYDKERYSLCRVSFDPATGHIGQKVDTLVNAPSEGKSVSWPRPSYDGRFLMYTLADYGYFTIWHPESDLWLLDLKTGLSRSLDTVNSSQADSFHNWSSDSQWFLFTSRRDDGRYSRIYLSSIGHDGRATKPFMLPQRDPKQFYTQSLYSYNTPDFTSRPVGNDTQAQIKALESGERIPTMLK